MKVLILAAGYGTRLYPLIKDTPKALLPINNKPLVNYILDRIGSISGLKEVILVTNAKFYSSFQQWAREQSGFVCPIAVINDRTQAPEDRLGSIGDIDFVLRQTKVDDDLLVVGSDNLFDYNVEDYVSFAQQKSPSVTVGLYDVRNLQEAKKYGVAAVGRDSKIISFEEKPDRPRSSLVAMCFYFMPKGSLGLIGQYLSESDKSDKAGDYICWLHRKNRVYGFQFTGRWYDIGSIEAYKEAQMNFK